MKEETPAQAILGTVGLVVFFFDVWQFIMMFTPKANPAAFGVGMLILLIILNVLDYLKRRR